MMRTCVSRYACLGMLLVAVAARPTAAQMENAVLQAIPGDAWAALVVRSPAEFDQKIQTMMQQLNAPPMSPLAMVKGYLMLSGINDNAGAAAVIMPVDNIMDPMSGFAMLVPCQDFTGMIEPLQPQDAGDGVSKVMLMGQETFVANAGAFAVMGPAIKPVQQLLAAKGAPGIDKSLTAHQLTRYRQDDISLWINLQKLVASPQVAPMLMMMAQSGQMQMEDIQSLRCWGISVRLDKEAVFLGAYQGLVAGTKPAEVVASMPMTAQTMLTGLPGDDYAVAFGAKLSKEYAAVAAQQFSGMLANPMMAMQLRADPQKMTELGQVVSSMITDLRGVSASVSSLNSGSDGLLGVTKVLTVDGDAKGLSAKLRQIIGLFGSGLIPGEEAKKAMEYVKFTEQAETINGVKVDHLSVNIDEMVGADAGWAAQVKKIFGREGVLFRMAAIDGKHVTATFGGGTDRMKQAIALVKENAAPLSADAGVKAVAALLPSSRTIEGYLSTSNLMTMATNIARTLDEEAPPAFPKVAKPAAMTGMSVEKSGVQWDFAVPMEVIVAIKDTVLAQQAGGTVD